jgi:hypothetical protein
MPSNRSSHVHRSRWLSVVLLVVLAVAACSSDSEPPTMSVVNQTNGVGTEIQADSWCLDGLLTESCAAVDGPVPEVVGMCDDQFVVALPDSLSPTPGDALAQFPAEDGESWPVAAQEGTVLVRATGSGTWSTASWIFELVRERAQDC